jgi:Domain of unknown function (DUF4375)
LNTSKPWYDGDVSGAMDDFITLERAYRVDSLVSALDSALERQGTPNGRPLTDVELTVIAVNSLEERVNTGGYASFFNYDREMAPIILRSLAAIGATECADLTKKALDIRGVADFLTGKSGEDTLDEATEEVLNQIDQRYFDAGIAMCDPIWEYVKANRDKISLDGDSGDAPARPGGLLSRLLEILRGRKR